MADDIAGLIQALKIAPAHVVGQSMGGMIAQNLVIGHPDLVASLTLFYMNWLEQLAEMSYQRDPAKSGNVRQATAVFTSPDRLQAIASIAVPTTIITGEADRLVYHHASDELHRHIMNSRLRKFPGMGHEIVEHLWPQFVHEIADTAQRACQPPMAFMPRAG